MMYIGQCTPCAKRETRHGAFVLMQRGGNAISIFICRLVSCLLFLLYSTVHLPRMKRHQDSWIFMQSPPPPQLSSRYSKPKTARVRFYFTLVRMAIITKTPVFIPFDEWWKKTKENELWQEHKEAGAWCIANASRKCLPLWKGLVFYQKGKFGVAMWHSWFNVWHTSKSNENWSQTFYTNVYRKRSKIKGNHLSIYQQMIGLTNGKSVSKT